jgi:hypothetical protein
MEAKTKEHCGAIVRSRTRPPVDGKPAYAEPVESEVYISNLPEAERSEARDYIDEQVDALQSRSE